MNNDFSDISIKITKKIEKNTKKNNGIYFTPFSIIKKNIDIINKYINYDECKNILEPSCGSCQFLDILTNIEELKHSNIFGIEIIKDIYDDIIKLKFNNINTLLLNIDYLLFTTNIKFDLIIGNPPYYVIKKEKVNKEYLSYFEGRPNIFILFIIKSLELLNVNGILSFILPKNFINCIYYNKLREFIYTNYTILDIVECNDDKFIDTLQDTIIFIIQNKKDVINNNSKFVLSINKFIIFNTKDNIIKLKELYENSNDLHTLKFKVNVGNIAWNEYKHLLTNDNTKTRLIYNSDINNDNTLSLFSFKNDDKKNYIDKKGVNGISIIVNRGYGVGKYIFKYSLLNVDYPYLLENHIIYIKYIGNNDNIDVYNKILNSFNNKKTKEFIDIYFGNNAINTTELNYLLPIYL